MKIRPAVIDLQRSIGQIIIPPQEHSSYANAQNAQPCSYIQLGYLQIHARIKIIEKIYQKQEIGVPFPGQG